MVYMFEDIPNDVLVNHIGCNISIVNIACLANVYNFIKPCIEELSKISIQNYEIYGFYEKELGLDFMNDVLQSVFDIYQLDNIIRGIWNNDVASVCLNFDRADCRKDINSINSTFKIFQMFQMETDRIYNSWQQMNDREIMMNEITNSLLRYFRIVFQERNKIRIGDEENIMTQYILSQCKFYGWHKVDINIYMLYENYKLIRTFKSSFSFTSYMKNNTTLIMNNTSNRQVETLMYLLAITDTGTMYERVYCFYEIFKLLNIIYRYETMVNYFLYQNDFTISCLTKLQEFRTTIMENSSVFPKYFVECVFSQFDNFVAIAKI